MYIIKRLYATIPRSKLIPNCRSCKHYKTNTQTQTDLCGAFIAPNKDIYTDEYEYYTCAYSRKNENMCGIDGKKYIRETENEIKHTYLKRRAICNGISSLGAGMITCGLMCHNMLSYGNMIISYSNSMSLSVIFGWIASSLFLSACKDDLKMAKIYKEKSNIPKFITYTEY